LSPCSIAKAWHARSIAPLGSFAPGQNQWHVRPRIH
jgi:hypothetical protein